MGEAQEKQMNGEEVEKEAAGEQGTGNRNMRKKDKHSSSDTSLASNRCHICSCEQVCLTTTPAA